MTIDRRTAERRSQLVRLQDAVRIAELEKALCNMTEYMVQCHSFSDEGVLTDDRDSWPSEWRLIDAARAALK